MKLVIIVGVINRGKRMVMLQHVNDCRFVYKAINIISLLCRRRCSNEGHFMWISFQIHYLLNDSVQQYNQI